MLFQGNGTGSNPVGATPAEILFAGQRPDERHSRHFDDRALCSGVAVVHTDVEALDHICGSQRSGLNIPENIMKAQSCKGMQYGRLSRWYQFLFRVAAR